MNRLSHHCATLQLGGDCCRMLKMTSRLLLYCLLTVVLVPWTYCHATEECITTFAEFERRSMLDNPGNMDALTKAFYRTNWPFPLSVQIVYRTNSSNGTDTIISTDPTCPPGKEMWLWIPSPVFIFMDPTKLNLYALNTLNYFSSWSPPVATVYVPSTCNVNHSQFNFLNDMTMRVSINNPSHMYICNCINILDVYIFLACNLNYGQREIIQWFNIMQTP